RRNRSDGDVDGRTAAACLAAASARVARADPGAARRGRGTCVPGDRSRPLPRGVEDGSRHRAARGSRRARHGGPDKVRPTDGVQAPLLRSLLAELDDLADVRDLIERTLVDEPGAFARDGGFTRDGVDPGLDELKTISRSGRQVIAEMEERERARTGIGSLKVRFNRV